MNDTRLILAVLFFNQMFRKIQNVSKEAPATKSYLSEKCRLKPCCLTIQITSPQSAFRNCLAIKKVIFQSISGRILMYYACYLWREKCQNFCKLNFFLIGISSKQGHGVFTFFNLSPPESTLDIMPNWANPLPAL